MFLLVMICGISGDMLCVYVFISSSIVNVDGKLNIGLGGMRVASVIV